MTVKSSNESPSSTTTSPPATTTSIADSISEIETSSTTELDSPTTTTTFIELELTESDQEQILTRSERAAQIWWFEATSTVELATLAQAEELITNEYANQLTQLDRPMGPASPDQLRILAVTIAFVDVDFVVAEVALEVISNNDRQRRYFELTQEPAGWQIRSVQ